MYIISIFNVHVFTLIVSCSRFSKALSGSAWSWGFRIIILRLHPSLTIPRLKESGFPGKFLEEECKQLGKSNP